MSLKAILFDFDGTLVNSEHQHFLAMQQTMQQHGIDMDFETYQARHVGVKSREIAEDIFPGQSPDTYDQIVDQKESTYVKDLSKTDLPMIPVTRGVLEWAQSQKLLIGLVTNASRQAIMATLPQLGLEKAFYTKVFGNELPFAKPHPLPYQTALEDLGVTPEEAVVFEDSSSGITSALKAGIKTIAISNSTMPPQQGVVAAYKETDNPQDVITLLNSWI